MKNTLAASEVSAKSRFIAMRRVLLVSCAFAMCAGSFCCLLLCSACSKSKHEPRLIGKRSDPPVSLHCAWQPGSRYHLRLDLAVLTDSNPPEPDDSSRVATGSAPTRRSPSTGTTRGTRCRVPAPVPRIRTPFPTSERSPTVRRGCPISRPRRVRAHRPHPAPSRAGTAKGSCPRCRG